MMVNNVFIQLKFPLSFALSCQFAIQDASQKKIEDGCLTEAKVEQRSVCLDIKIRNFNSNGVNNSGEVLGTDVWMRITRTLARLSKTLGWLKQRRVRQFSSPVGMNFIVFCFMHAKRIEAERNYFCYGLNACRICYAD